MSEHLVEIDIHNPAEIFAERQGEARIDEHALMSMSRRELRSFQDTLNAYVATHPKLDVVTLIHRGAPDELVIRWRWRG